MQILARGAQFEVTTDGNNVYKRLLATEESEAVYKSWGYSLLGKNLKQLATDSLELARLSLHGIQILLVNSTELAPSLGNPVIQDNLNYRQDKATLLGYALAHRSTQDAKALIDSYIDTCLMHAGYGFADTTFNIAVNYGVDANDMVILLDLGELTFDKEVTVRAAATKKWQRAQNFWAPFYIPKSSVIPLRLKPYYWQQMTKRLSPETIASNWQKSTSDPG